MGGPDPGGAGDGGGTTPISRLASLEAAQREDVRRAMTSLIRCFSTFVIRAQQAGVMKPDLSGSEVLELIVRVVMPRVPLDARKHYGLSDNLEERYTRILLDGLHV